jgi:uncharacterized delta-60 repeat protein
MYSTANLKNYIFINRAPAWNLMILIAVFFLLSAAECLAAIGNLDRRFADGGKAIAFVNGAEKAMDATVQPDGKILVVGGAAANGATFDFCVLRYNADGTPDQTFGEAGKKLVSVSQTSDVAYAVALQSDGKILVGGYAQQPNQYTDFAVIRLLPNGSLDQTFGAAGMKVFSPSDTTDIVYALATQTLGGVERIIVGGGAGTANVKFCVARLNPDGQLDATFGDGGSGMKLAAAGSTADSMQDLTVDEQARIVAAGFSRIDFGANGYRDDFAAMRFLPNGQLDAAFDGDGKLTTPMGGSAQARSIVAQRIGGATKYTLGGITHRGGFNDFALLRLNENGLLDSSFNATGKAFVDFKGQEDQIQELLAQPDGKIIGVGHIIFGSNRDYALARLNVDGSLDKTFGSCGRITTDLRSTTDIAYGAALQPDGKIIAVGESVNGSTGADFTTVRYTAGGQATATSVDYDGDGKTDVSVFRPSNGIWYQNCSCDGIRGVAFGQAGDKPVPADYDGDGKTDVAIYRAGYWYLNQSQTGFRAVQFGTVDDVPTVGDYDGDERADIAVFRPSNGYWYILRSSDNQFDYKTFGQPGDKPVQADYDRDGKTDVAVYRPASGTWFVLKSSDASITANPFGGEADVPTVGDFDGDGKTDFSVFRPANGTWYQLRSAGATFAAPFGIANDIPVAGDYDGDGNADIAVYRNGAWYIRQSATNNTRSVSFGAAGDVPLTIR